jgi:hypothetical protein
VIQSLREGDFSPTDSPAVGGTCGFEMTVGFRLISYKTIVFSKELNFYDEVNKHLTMPDEFEEWVEKNVERVRSWKLRTA